MCIFQAVSPVHVQRFFIACATYFHTVLVLLYSQFLHIAEEALPALECSVDIDIL